MKKKFSTLLLTGKAAALPFFVQPAQAYTPSFTDILNTQISQVEVPVADQVVLDSLGGDVYSGAVTLCTGANAVNNMSVVITGLKNKDYVYLIAATTLGGLESFDNRIKIGSENQKTQALGAVSAPDGATVAMSVPLDLSKITKPVRTTRSVASSTCRPLFLAKTPSAVPVSTGTLRACPK